MRFFIMLTISISTLFGQDSLIAESGAIYLGKLIEISESHVIFQALDAPWPHSHKRSNVVRVALSAGESIIISDIQEPPRLTRPDGTRNKTSRLTDKPTDLMPIIKTLNTWDDSNIIYWSVGFIPFYAITNGYYEKLLINLEDQFFDSYWLRVGGGVYDEGWGAGSGTNWVAGLTALKGSDQHFLEVNIGRASRFAAERYEKNLTDAKENPALKNPKSIYRDSYPSGGIGYRYLFPSEKAIFRVGIGWPEPVHFSFGIRF